MNLNPQLQQLAEKYYLLMSIEEPSDDELHQLEEILELATIDEELNNLLLVVPPWGTLDIFAWMQKQAHFYIVFIFIIVLACPSKVVLYSPSYKFDSNTKTW